MPPPFLLSPINDAVFKMIFGDSHDIGHLTNFLKSALTIPPEDYEERNSPCSQRRTPR
ncbi:hypothetical protein AGMMS50225_03450 [Betaproteobacteria bacterium]|nr:hypothetical protein AGMMS50225_03450 [Betaproteobacteria bacterium]